MTSPTTKHFGIFALVSSLVLIAGCMDGMNMWGPVGGESTYVPGCDPDNVGPCPESIFNCTQDDVGNKECVGREPSTPDGGDWDCSIVGDQLHCVGDHFPSDMGEWTCWQEGDEVVCESNASLPTDDGESGSWECHYQDDTILCTADGSGDGNTDDDPGDDDDTEGGDDTVGDDGDDEQPGGEDLSGGDDPGDETPGDDDPGDEEPGDDEPGEAPGDGSSSCEPWVETTVWFGRSGELVSLDRAGDYVDCTTVEVSITGHYAFYDDRIAESCGTQLDETGFLTVTNSCNPLGLPEENNVGDYYVVQDVDNTERCSSDSECGAGMACRSGNAGYCCVPDEPVYMGTFLLRADEPNELCVNHWCPLWRDGRSGDGFVNSGCSGSINSIHVALDGSMRVCFDPTSADEGC